jgi:hypothetical protein
VEGGERGELGVVDMVGVSDGRRGEDAGWYDRLVWLFSSFGN